MRNWHAASHIMAALCVACSLSACQAAPSTDARGGSMGRPLPTATAAALTATPLPLPGAPTPGVTPLASPTATPTYDPGPAGELLATGNRRLDAGDISGALNSYSLAIQADHSYAEAYYRRSLVYLALGDYKAALADLTLALDIDPYHSGAYVARARVYAEQGSVALALGDLMQAEAINPRNGETYLVRGRLLRLQGEIGHALDDLNRAVVLMPDHAPAYYERALLYRQAGNNELALIDLNVALSLQPDHPEAHYARAEILAAEGRSEEAIVDYEAARDLGLESVGLFVALGRAYLETGDTASARETLAGAACFAPFDSDVHYWLGLALFVDGDFTGAVTEANAVLALAPASVEALSLRAASRMNLGEWQAAIDDFAAAYALDETYAEALFGIAQVYLLEGRPLDAARALEEYLAAAPPDAPNRPAAVVLLDALRQGVLATPTAAPVQIPRLP